jgi:hypothetical protein
MRLSAVDTSADHLKMLGIEVIEHGFRHWAVHTIRGTKEQDFDFHCKISGSDEGEKE